MSKQGLEREYMDQIRASEESVVGVWTVQTVARSPRLMDGVEGFEDESMLEGENCNARVLENNRGLECV